MTEIMASIGRYPHTAALFEPGVQFGPDVALAIEAGGTAAASRLMLQDLAYDICEMPIANYVMARERGTRLTAMPVFTTRRFPHGMLALNNAAGAAQPADLSGKKVGIPYHGNTDVVWVRGLLQAEYGLDLDSVTWVSSLGETIEPYIFPPNLDQHIGSSLGEMLLSGELAGLVEGRGRTIFADGIEGIEQDAPAAEKRWYEKTGVFPVLFTVVMRDDLAGTRRELCAAIFSAFVTAKLRALADIDAGTALSEEGQAAAAVSGFRTEAADRWPRSYLGPDPLRYGLAANYGALDMLCGFMAGQGLTRARTRPEDVFLDLEEADVPGLEVTA